jgi:hypothetical protein
MFAKVLNQYLSLIVFIVIAGKAPDLWGFSFSRTENYLQKTKELRLWEDPKWIKLGHYEKKLGGYKSSFRGPFYLNEDGYASPEKELLATVQALFSDSPELTKSFTRHPQCQFLARRRWLISKLQISNEDILPCKERVQWKKQLGATTVAIIFASADISNPASSFGHTFLKLINPANAKNKDLIDYGVNYAADADPHDGIFYGVRGLFGGYRGIYTMLPYHQKIREYINLEGRDLTEYVLRLSPDEVDEMIDHLLELEKTSAPYYFLTDNCSYEILYLLDIIRPELQLTEKLDAWVIPADTIKVIDRHSDLILERRYKKSLNTEYLEGYSQLGALQKKALDVAVDKLKIPEDFELSPKEKAEVYETGMRYFAIVNYRSGEKTEDKKYQLSSLRADLGPVTTDIQDKKPLYPETSHDSSALYFGGGSLDSESYSMLKFRAAFHDLEQKDVGMVPMSLNNAFVFDVRYFNELKKLSLYRFTVINLINTDPVTQLDRNISWKARIELLDSFRPDIEYAAGYSFDLSFLPNSRLSYLLAARYLKDIPESQYENLGQIGPDVLFISKPWENFGFSAELSYLAQDRQTPYLRFKTKMNYELKQNYDIQLSADDKRDYQISFLRNFIF